MKNYIYKAAFFVLIIGMISCSSGTKTKINFMHGQKVPDNFINILKYTPTEIEFNIRVKFQQDRLYHIILDQEENRLAEGWFRTTRLSESSYPVLLTAKEGVIFQPDTRYRLCIGSTSPDLVGRYQSSYKCYADYEFILPKNNLF